MADDHHHKTLEKLCRFCGEALQKYVFHLLKYKELTRETTLLNVESDISNIHPSTNILYEVFL